MSSCSAFAASEESEFGMRAEFLEGGDLLRLGRQLYVREGEKRDLKVFEVALIPNRYTKLPRLMGYYRGKPQGRVLVEFELRNENSVELEPGSFRLQVDTTRGSLFQKVVHPKLSPGESHQFQAEVDFGESGDAELLFKEDLSGYQIDRVRLVYRES
ncbi:MAG: hypothetical protein AAF517_15565 [Planctomycetota bacterium]